MCAPKKTLLHRIVYMFVFSVLFLFQTASLSYAVDREDPLVAFKFGLESEGKIVGYFNSGALVGPENEVIEHRITDPETGQEMIQKIPGSLIYSAVRLERRISSSVTIWEWRQQVVDDNIQGARKNISIIAYDQENQEIARWFLLNAWPSKISNSLTASGTVDGVAETLWVVIEGLSRSPFPQPPPGPSISNIPDQNTNEDTIGPIPFTIGPSSSSLSVSASSSNPTLVPDNNILLGGSGTDRTLTIVPAANRSGTTTIIVTVTDGNASATDSFVLTVIDGCPNDSGKTKPGICGCGTPDTDTDIDGTADCNDGCPTDPSKTAAGICGCGVADTDTDTDSDGIANCVDPDDDNDGALDANDSAPFNPDMCENVDGDGCNDCAVGTDDLGPLADNDPNNDGPDNDGDGQCDASDPDDDNDGVLDAGDSAPFDPDVCDDTDADGCDDCAVGTDDFGLLADYTPANDGSDTDGDGLCDAGDPDDDGDGISDEIDTSPTAPSIDFSDVSLDPPTTGTITGIGDQTLTIIDEPNPAGVRITAAPSVEGTPATVSVCGGSSIATLSPGDEVVVTCGSVTVEVIRGTVEIEFVAADGSLATTSLGEGNSLLFLPTTFTFTAPSTNPVPIVVLIEREEISLERGESKTMMASFVIDQAKIEVLKGKARVKGTLMLKPNGDDVDISEPITVTVRELSQTVKMVEKGKKGERWEYKHPKGDTGIIKEMKIDWKKGKFEFRIDKADLSGLTDPNDVNISIQIGDDFGQQTILMREKKHHWDYKD